MEINPSQFGGFSFDGLKDQMAKGNTVTTEFNLVFQPVNNLIHLKRQADPDAVEEPVWIETFNNDEKGLKQAIITGFEVLRDWEDVDGFQVENEVADTFEFASFEVLGLELAMQTYVDARKKEPEHHWLMNIIGHNDVEDPSLVVGVADFELDNAPV